MKTEIGPSDNNNDSLPQKGEMVCFIATEENAIAILFRAEVVTVMAESNIPLVKILESRTLRKGNGWPKTQPYEPGKEVLLAGVKIIRKTRLDQPELPTIIQIGPENPKGKGEVSFINLDPRTGVFYQVVQTGEDQDFIRFMVRGASNGEGWRQWTADKTNLSIPRNTIKRFSFS